MLDLVKIVVMLWLAFMLTLFVGLMFAHAVSERRAQSRAQDEFLRLMETRGYASEQQAKFCMDCVEQGDYRAAANILRRGLLSE